MENRDNQNTDVSKTVQAHQSQSERSLRPEQSQQGQDATGQAQPSEPSQASQAGFGNERQSGTLTGERGDGEAAQASDIEGASADQSGGSFIGTQGSIDTSSELIEDDSDFARDGRGAPE